MFYIRLFCRFSTYIISMNSDTAKVFKPNNFIKSALIVSLGGLIAKVIGAVYRIPLTNLLGSYGMGLYQLVFPPYVLIMILVSFGLPTALSKLIAENNQKGEFFTSQAYFVKILRLLALFGGLGSAILFLFAPFLATVQNNPCLTLCYRLISPAILFVCITAAFRAFFQGNMNMMPVSFSQVSEQIIKLIIGLASANLFMPDTVKAVYGAVAAITISEVFSLLIVLFAYLRVRKNLPKINKTDYSKTPLSCIFSLALPIVLGGFIMQITQLIDSVMVVNMIKSSNATSLYGIWTGPVNSLLGLPTTLSAGVAVSTLPSIARVSAMQNKFDLQKRYNTAIKLTLVIALPVCLGMMMLSRPIVSLLYGGLLAAEIEVAAYLLTIAGLSVVCLSLLQTVMATLQALGKPYVAVYILSFAILIKFIFNLFLLGNPSVNIYAAAISETMCFSFACISAIIYLRVKVGLHISLEKTLLKPLACSTVMMLCLTLLRVYAFDFTNTAIGTLISICICGVVYLASTLALKVFDNSEIKIPRRKNERDIPAKSKNPID